MISLDEDYVGMADDAIIIRALKVCGGVLARLSNNRLLGAHFTNITTPDEILTGCTYLMNHYAGGNNVVELYFVANLYAWQQRGDKYKNTHTLGKELKLMFRYGGSIKINDKNIVGASVDVRFDAGNPAQIGYRTTLTNDPLVNTPNNNVKHVKTRGKTPVVENMGQIYNHKLPTTTTGFTPFPSHMFVAV
ncbi:MAG: hypothetical protein ACFCBW_08530 [Candidatus Competibacterales bacterium]